MKPAAHSQPDLRAVAARLFPPGPSNRFARWVRHDDRSPARAIDRKASQDPASRNRGLHRLLGVLDDPRPAVRQDALRAIAALHGRGVVSDESVDRLLAEVGRRTHLDAETRLLLIALGRAQVPGLSEGFLQIVKAGDPGPVAAATYVLGAARFGPAVPALVRTASEVSHRAGPAAVWALGQIGDVAALPVLHGLATRRRQLTNVPGALGEIGASVSIPVLTALLTDLCPSVRFLTAAALLAIGVDRGQRSVRATDAHAIRAAIDREPHHRVAAALTLAAIALGVPFDATRAARTLSAS